MLLAARGVGRTYGRLEALQPTTLELHAGETVALVGPNGAGKSTLLAILAGHLPATSGTVETAPAATGVGWAPQGAAQYGHLSARENLELFARLAGLPEPVAAAEQMLARMGLPDGVAPARQLSAGNQQRLNLALGLLGEPRVLLLDEPTASLDPKQRQRLWTMVDEHRARGGATVLASHSSEEVARLADRVLALIDGRIVFEGGPHELEGAVPELRGT